MTRRRSSAHSGARATARLETEEEAGLILYNTCSIRDKAEQRVFTASTTTRDNKIWASASVFWDAWPSRRARRSSSERRTSRWSRIGLLPQAARDARPDGGRRTRITGLDDRQTDETFETEFTARTNPYRAYITIIEGCDKFCAYCVCLITRGKERSRTSTSVLAEARRIADLGYTEIPIARPEREQLHRPGREAELR